jgi:hypothetical protein
LCAYAATKVIRSYGGFDKFLACLMILSASPYFLIAAYGGMESSIILPLLLLFFKFDKEKKVFLALTIIAMTVIIRFEMLALFIPIVSIYFLEKKIKPALVILFFLFLFFLIEVYLYGTIIPYASIAKSIGYNIPLQQSIVNAISLNSGGAGPYLGLLILFLLIYSIFLFLKILYFEKELKITLLKRIAFILASFAIIVSWIIGSSNIFKWYLIPVCSLALIFALYSIDPIERKKNDAVKILSVLLMLGFGNIGGISFISNQGFLKESNANRTYEYKKIGDFLYSICPDCSMVTSEIGALGWSFEGLVYDGFGLADPKALAFHPLKVPSERSDYGIGAIPPDYIKYRNPDFIVSLPIFIELFSSSVNKTYFKYQCKTISTFLGNNQIMVYSKFKFDDSKAASINCHQNI